MIRGESARMWGATAGTAILGTVLLLGGAFVPTAHGKPGTRASQSRGSDAAGTAHPALEAHGVTFEFVRIEPGQFRMGSEDGDPDERPVRQVGIGYAFEMGRTEVTVRQFRAFVEATGYRTVAEREGAAWHMWSPEGLKWSRRCHWRKLPFEQTDDDAVVCISYLDAVAFCKWLSAETGQTIRLPTEAEWEYACRAGMAATDAGDLEAAAWFDRNSGARPHRVGRKMPNPWGLHDMHGNVAEWCVDAYRWHYRDAPVDGRPFIAVDVPAPAAVRRVLRGGSWCLPSTFCRSASRWPAPQALRTTDTGFRLVRGPMLETDPFPIGETDHRQAALAAATRKEGGETTTGAHDEEVGGVRKVSGPGRLTLTVDGVAFEFVRIEPGTFPMGSPHRYVDAYDWTYEMPVRKVTIERPCYMGTTEVTVEQFRLFVEQTGYVTDAEKQGRALVADEDWHFELLADWRFPGFVQTDREPATVLSWYDCLAFCRWLSERTGCEVRLPSEAEWEYACRAGATGDYAGALDAMAWYRCSGARRTHPVAQRQPNAWGLYDMHGNVWEWVQDLWHGDCNDAPTDGSAWLATSDVDPRGITRGGSFHNPAWLCRSYIRMQTPLGYVVHFNNGFRLVCVPQEEEDECPDAGLAPIEVELPNRQFRGTPKDFRAPFTKPVQTEEGPPFLAPAGTTNVALGKPVSGSDEMPVIGELEMVTDGDKEAADGSFVELGPFRQHVTIDLEAEHEIYGLRLWHYHQEARVYFDVVIQVSNDPNFATGVKTVFNNDRDNSSGLGIGRDMHYVETHFGEVVDARGVRGRYVRLYSRGNTADDLNHYIEVEVYGRPVSKGTDSGVDPQVRRAADGTRLVPLEINYPKPLFIGFGRWKDVPYREEFPVEPPAPLLVPEGTTNLALGKPVLSCDHDLIIGRLDMITDGDKDFRDGHYVELDHGGLQHITIDLQQLCEIHAVAVWHYYAAPRVYFDVILQISEGPMGSWTRKTFYNSDLDNSARFGVGTDKRYIETNFGKVIPVDSVSGRYVRLYSNGSSMGELNQYVEVEVYGRPVEGR